MRLNNPIIKCPLPHLGYGIDADGNGVELTPNNVGVEYSDNGSDYLLENGAVDKFSNDFYNRNLAAPLKKENYEKENYITWNENDNSIITGTNTYSSLFVYQLNKEKVLKGFKYTFSASTDSDAKILFRFIDSNMEIITEYTKYFSYNIYYMGHIRGYNSPVTFIVPLNCAYIQFGIASAATNLFLKDPVLKLSSDNQNIYIPNNTSKTPLYSIESGDTLINGSNFLNNTPFKIDMLNINTDLEYAFFNKSDETIWDDFVRASDNFDTENPYLWDMEEINQQFIYDHCLIEYQYWIKNINNIIKDIILYDKPLPLLRSLNERNDSTITDSIAGRNANIKGLASSFNGVDGSVDLGRPEIINFIPQIDAFEIEGWFKVPVGYTGTLYSIGSRASVDKRQIQLFIENNEIRLHIGDAVTVSINSFENDGLQHFLKLSVPASNTGIIVYIDNIQQIITGDTIGNYIGTENAYFGARTDGESFLLTGNLWDWKFYSGNGESRKLVLNVPLPHTGIGFDANGDTVELTVSGGVTQEIVDGGSLWMQEHGAVFSNNPDLVKDGSFPLGTTEWGASGESTLQDGYANILSTDMTYSRISQNNIFEVGKEYIVEYTILRSTGPIALQDPERKLNIELGTHKIKYTPINTTLTIKRFASCDTDITNISVKEADNYIPNNESNELAYSLEEGQIAIPAAPNYLNTTPFGITLFTEGQTNLEYAFFDKSDATIWDDFVRASDNYDSDNTGVWDSTELNQEFINEHCLLSSKYEIDIINNVIKNITLKDSSSVVVSNLKKYVRLG